MNEQSAAPFRKNQRVQAEDIIGYFSHASADGKTYYVKPTLRSQKLYGFFAAAVKPAE